MAISTDAAIEFFGTQDSVGGGGGTVANGAFSATGDVSDWTNDDDAPEASIVLEATWGTAPSAGTAVHLYARPMNIEGTNDMQTPDGNFQHVYLGVFPVNDVTSTQYIPIRVQLPNNASSQVYEFFIENQTGQTISANWDLHVTPVTIGPHA